MGWKSIVSEFVRTLNASAPIQLIPKAIYVSAFHSKRITSTKFAAILTLVSISKNVLLEISQTWFSNTREILQVANGNFYFDWYYSNCRIGPFHFQTKTQYITGPNNCDHSYFTNGRNLLMSLNIWFLSICFHTG